MERFWSKVAVRSSEECWEWMASKYWNGYGAFFFEGRVQGAHAVAFKLTHGRSPVGGEVRHTCDNRVCCNPAHLLEGTRLDNARDMAERGRGRNHNTGRTHCKRGHEFTPENTRLRSDGSRACLTCEKERLRRVLTRKPAGGGLPRGYHRVEVDLSPTRAKTEKPII